MELWPKQERLMKQLDGYFQFNPDFRSGFIKQPPGIGKTVEMSTILWALRQEIPDLKAGVFSPRVAINEQNLGTIQALQANPEDAGLLNKVRQGEPCPDITVGCYQLAKFEALKLNPALDRLSNHYDIIFVDECHHMLTMRFIEILKERYPNAIIIGLSATPYVGSGLDPNEWKAAWHVFEGMIDEVSLLQAVYDGDIVPIRAWQFNVDEKEKEDLSLAELSRVMAQVLKEKVPENQTGIAFCSGIDHAEYTAQKMQEIGIKAEWISGSKHNRRQQKAIIEALRAGELQWVTSSDLLIEGIDIKPLQNIAIARKLSPAQYIQALGRGNRNHPGKKIMNLFDFIRRGPQEDERGHQFNFSDLERLFGIQRAVYEGGELFGYVEDPQSTSKGNGTNGYKRWDLHAGSLLKPGAALNLKHFDTPDAKEKILRNAEYYSNPEHTKKDLTSIVQVIKDQEPGSILSAHDIQPNLTSHLLTQFICANGEVTDLRDYLAQAAASYGLFAQDRINTLLRLLQVAGFPDYPEFQTEGDPRIQLSQLCSMFSIPSPKYQAKGFKSQGLTSCRASIIKWGSSISVSVVGKGSREEAKKAAATRLLSLAASPELKQKITDAVSVLQSLKDRGVIQSLEIQAHPVTTEIGGSILCVTVKAQDEKGQYSASHTGSESEKECQELASRKILKQMGYAS